MPRPTLQVRRALLLRGVAQQGVPGRQSPCGAVGTGAFVAEWANTVPVVETATNNAASTIFLSMGVSLWSGGCGVGKTRHELTRLSDFQEQPKDQCGEPENAGLTAGKQTFRGGGFISVYASEVTFYCSADLK